MKSSIPRQAALFLILAAPQAFGNAGQDAATPASAQARASAVYVLALHQTVALGPGTTLRLDQVDDSRCKPGQTCIWAGYIGYRFTLKSAGGSSTFMLADGMPNMAKSVTQQGLTFTLENDDAHMATARPASAPDCRVSLRVDNN